jgi:hypothetical protein
MQPVVCQHKRIEVLARRDGVDYVECLDCRTIFEADDLELEDLQTVGVDDDSE